MIEGRCPDRREYTAQARWRHDFGSRWFGFALQKFFGQAAALAHVAQYATRRSKRAFFFSDHSALKLVEKRPAFTQIRPPTSMAARVENDEF